MATAGVVAPARTLVWFAAAFPAATVLFFGLIIGFGADAQSLYLLTPAAAPLPAFAWLLATQDATAFRGICIGMGLLLGPYGVVTVFFGGFGYLPSIPLLLLAAAAARRDASWSHNGPAILGLIYMVTVTTWIATWLGPAFGLGF
ncbi:hypothetical protein [Yinghuangia soli]|uniref:Tripartite tricarboxylate transporter TctB family protein n=1 Tax=Yinghuangia soli TaxID=2908204 RepID=A0AA41Q4H5_9ACTN|nr:hypothetical protein [Yinghuangia soli]MCF2530541.1 hypothetical protein [Yinghuangia soli]